MSKTEQVQELADAIGSILSLHRGSFPPAERQVLQAQDVVSQADLTARFEKEAIKGVGIFQLRKRSKARTQAQQLALSEHVRLEAIAEQDVVQRQQDHDRAWEALVANDPDAVLALLAAAFEDNEASAAAVGVVGDAVSLVVEVPTLDEVPDRMPGVTAAGNPSLKKASKKDRNALYIAMLSGYILITVKEAFAVAPGIQRANVVAVRKTSPDAYGQMFTEAVMAVAFDRDRLDGIRWETAEAAQILNAASAELIAVQKGTAQELMPVDLAANPEIRHLVQAVNLSA